MCPVCITTAVLSAAGATSGAGVIAVAAGKWRTLRRWVSACAPRSSCCTRGSRDAATTTRG
jgi:hypothetical protein